MKIILFNLLLCAFQIQETSILNKYLKALGHKLPDTKNIVVIIPTNSCNECCKHTLEFAKKYNTTKKTVIISSFSVREAEIFINNTAKGRKFLIDTKMKAFKLGLVESYPVIYLVKKNGHIAEKITVTALNSDKILTYIDNVAY